MQMAIDVAGFTPAEADRLRQAMGAKRSRQRMEALRDRLYAGMAERGITGEVADAIWAKLAAFADFGFPESHAVSFAYLVYSSAWLKLHHPDAFLAALLNAQPMGFYSPDSLVADARRHGVEVRGPDVNLSLAEATLEHPGAGSGSGGAPAAVLAVRLGLASVRNVGPELAERLVAGQPYADMEDLARRTEPGPPALEALATAGAFGSCSTSSGDGSRRADLWRAGAMSQVGADRLPGIVVGSEPPPLPPMTHPEEVAADLWSTGIATAGHPMTFLRDRLRARGVVTAAELASMGGGVRVSVAGVVTHRQRPSTAGGTIFVNLEDETGMVNVICSAGVWVRYRTAARRAAALVVGGRLENVDGAVNLVAERLEDLRLATPSSGSRNFR